MNSLDIYEYIQFLLEILYYIMHNVFIYETFYIFDYITEVYCSIMERIVKKVRILGIAPYEGMSNIMESLAEQRDDIELTTYVADLDEGAAFVTGIDLENYDAILSRGGTALAIHKIVDIPVFDMMLSYFDVLNAIKLAEGMNEKMAIVGYPSIATFAKQLCTILNMNIDIFVTNCWDDTIKHIDYMITHEYNLVLGDMSACRYAKERNFPSMLITSGSETVSAAFNQIVEFAGYYLDYQTANKFLKADLISRKESILVYNEKYNLVFSSVKKPSRFLLNETRRMINDLQTHGHKKNIKNQKEAFYNITGEKRTFSNQSYFFYHIIMKHNTDTFSTGSVTKADTDNFDSQLFSFLYNGNSYYDIRKAINSISNSRNPILIEGEEGTGKDRLAAIIHFKSKLHTTPLFVINCQTFSSEELKGLIQNTSSPFHDTDYTFYFKNCDLLSVSLTEQILAYISATNMLKRHRLIFSWRKNNTTMDNEVNYKQLKYKLGCMSFLTLTLQQCIDEIPKLSIMYINSLNVNNTTQIFGLEPEALSLLQGFKWSYNLDQLKRVLTEAVLKNHTPYITAQVIAPILHIEKKTTNHMDSHTHSDLDLNQSLKEITYDIVMKILVEENMNQSKVARRLQISRTTLWRILKDANL